MNKFSADGKVSYFSFAPGETVSIKVVFNGKADTPYIDLYANGVYAGSMNCNMFKGYDDNVKAGKSLDYSTSMITFLGIGAVSSTKDAFFIDNVTFK